MSRALITLAILSVASMLAAAVVGFIATASDRMPLYHLLLGLFASLFTTFIHCMVMFYFIGTSKVIREAAADLGTKERDYVRETRRLAASVHPLATLAIAVTIVGTLLGGAVRAGLVPSWVHLLGIAGALGVNVWVFSKQQRAAVVNSALIAELEAFYARKAKAS